MPQPRWKLVEAVVSAIESSEPDARVTPNAKVLSRTNPQETRQVDVYVETKLGRRQVAIAVEVKDEAKPLDITTVEQVAAKLADLRVDLGWLVSTSGYTSGASNRARRMGLRISTLAEEQDPHWFPFMPITSRSAEPIHVRVDYAGGPPASVVEAITRSSLADVTLVPNNGDPISLPELAKRQGMAALGKLEHQPADQQPFVAQIELPEGNWAALQVGKEQFPPPATITIVYRTHVEERTVETKTYALDDRQIHITTAPVALLPLDGEEDSSPNGLIMATVGVFPGLLRRIGDAREADLLGFHFHEVPGKGSVPCPRNWVVEPLGQAMIAGFHRRPDEMSSMAEWAVEQDQFHLAWRLNAAAREVLTATDATTVEAASAAVTVTNQYFDDHFGGLLHEDEIVTSASPEQSEGD